MNEECRVCRGVFGVSGRGEAIVKRKNTFIGLRVVGRKTRKLNPLRVCCGWSFGSICSLNRSGGNYKDCSNESCGLRIVLGKTNASKS